MSQETPKPSSIREEVGSIDQYQFISGNDLQSMFAAYGKETPLNGLYLRDDHSTAVGVLDVTAESCEGHFVGNPIWRGVDQLNGMVDTALALQILGNKPGQKIHPQFSNVRDIQFRNTVVPQVVDGNSASVVNIVARAANSDHEAATADTQILSGDTVISRGTIVHNSQPLPNVKGGLLTGPASTLGRHFGKEDVRKAFEMYGYGDSKQFIDEAWLTKAGMVDEIVARLSVDGRATEGHAFSPFNALEAMAQAMLLKAHLGKELKQDVTPRFTSIDRFNLHHTVKAPAALTVHINHFYDQPLMGIGNVYCGDVFVASATIRGSAIPVNLAEKMLARSIQQQRNKVPLFPLQS